MENIIKLTLFKEKRTFRVLNRQSLLLFDILFPTFAINFKINKKLNRTDTHHVI